MRKVTSSSSSSSTSYGLLAHIGLLFFFGPGMVSSSESQFCDECNPKIYDISQRLPQAGIPTWGKSKLRNVVQENLWPGSKLVTGQIVLGTHWATHVDSPIHSASLFRQHRQSAERLNLNTLMGPVLVVDTPWDTNITASVLQALNLPPGLKRVIFRTANTARKLMEDKVFVSNYTGLTADGAFWLVHNTTIDFVGIDYMSIARAEEVVPVHLALFWKSSIIPVEGLRLDEVKPGYYTVYCLPMKVDAEGAPVRCILVE